MTNEEREKAIAIDVFERQIKRSEDVKCRRCDECGENPFEDYCIKDVAKWLSLALEALKREPCEDAISRKTIKAIPLEKFKEMDKEVRNYFATTFYPRLSGVLMILHKHVELIDSPTRKHGEWERGYSYPDGQYVKCSECGEIIKCTYPMHFCPNCGADMRKWIKESKQ